MTTHSMFYEELTKALLKHTNNFHGIDNWDPARFGKRRLGLKRAIIERIVLLLNPILSHYGYSITTMINYISGFDKVVGMHGEGLSHTYSMLSDDYSKHAFIDILAYRMLGYTKVKLWTNTPDYWSARATAESLTKGGDEIDTGMDILHLSQADLRSIGYPISLYAHPLGIAHHFLLTNYAYEHTSPPVWLSSGDYVIDAGAAWGDTALRFAHEVGEKGRVYSFEFVPKNLEILMKNLELNEDLASRITVVKKAVWSDSRSTLSFNSQGPASHVREDDTGQKENQVACVSIDDFAESLPMVDFIKMDIEGAELPALQGAEKTIRKHRPKMAISLYHKLSDFIDIPAYLATLGLDYNFYIDHGTIHNEETILFAAPRVLTD